VSLKGVNHHPDRQKGRPKVMDTLCGTKGPRNRQLQNKERKLHPEGSDNQIFESNLLLDQTLSWLQEEIPAIKEEKKASGISSRDKNTIG
jgi:hypothetical protein